MMQNFLMLALCNGALAITLTKTRIFAMVRNWIAARSGFWGEMVGCPYCVLHYLSLVSIPVWHMKVTNCGSILIDYLASSFALTAVSAVVAGTIYKLFTAPTIRAEDIKSILSDR